MRERITKIVPRLVLVTLGLLLMVWPGLGGARGKQNTTAAGSNEQPYVIEYYYKAKWGHAEEFLALFKKNHYPVLKKEMELGRMLKVSMVTPRYHMTEDSRWDYRVTIVFKNAPSPTTISTARWSSSSSIPTRTRTKKKSSAASKF